MNDVNFNGLKKGDRVRLVYELTVRSVAGGDYLVSTDGGDYMLDSTFNDLVSVEKIEQPLPTELGWYESEKFPLATGWAPYELDVAGVWYLHGEPVSESAMKNLGPLYKLGRVDG